MCPVNETAAMRIWRRVRAIGVPVAVGNRGQNGVRPEVGRLASSLVDSHLPGTAGSQPLALQAGGRGFDSHRLHRETPGRWSLLETGHVESHQKHAIVGLCYWHEMAGPVQPGRVGRLGRRPHPPHAAVGEATIEESILQLGGPQPVHVSASAIRSPSQGSTPHRPEFTDRDALEHGLRQIREEAYELFVPADVGPLQAAAQRLGT